MRLTTKQQNFLDDLRHGDSLTGEPWTNQYRTLICPTETGITAIQMDGTVLDGAAGPHYIRFASGTYLDPIPSK